MVVVWVVVCLECVEVLVKLVVDEGGFGNYVDKVIKINKWVFGVFVDMCSICTVGVVDEDFDCGFVKIVKFVGVVVVLILIIGLDVTLLLKVLFVFKGCNVIVVVLYLWMKDIIVAVVDYMWEVCL